jgi:hypothetical protein
MSQVDEFIAKFAPPMQKFIRAARAAMRQRFPTATELVYDNYNFLVFAFSPTERPSDAILSLGAHSKGVNLFFRWGTKLPDPQGILEGAGKQVRMVRLENAGTLKKPEVEELIAAAVDLSRVPFPESGRGKTVVRAIVAKQRPRQ